MASLNTLRFFLVALLVTVPAVCLAQSQNQNPPAPPQTVQQQLDNAIPITPDMIRELARRQQDNSRTQEQALTPVASPVSRAISVNFAPGAATSIIQTVKGYLWMYRSPPRRPHLDKDARPWWWRGSCR